MKGGEHAKQSRVTRHYEVGLWHCLQIDKVGVEKYGERCPKVPGKPVKSKDGLLYDTSNRPATEEKYVRKNFRPWMVCKDL